MVKPVKTLGRRSEISWTTIALTTAGVCRIISAPCRQTTALAGKTAILGVRAIFAAAKPPFNAPIILLARPMPAAFPTIQTAPGPAPYRRKHGLPQLTAAWARPVTAMILTIQEAQTTDTPSIKVALFYQRQWLQADRQ